VPNSQPQYDHALAPPSPPLAHGSVRLEPLTRAHVPELLELGRDDAILRFTRIPSDAAGVGAWVDRYERGWHTGDCAGFAIRAAEDGGFLGFAALVHLDLDAREAEIGYAVVPRARGRGAATGALAALTRWGFDDLALERVELQIDAANEASIRVAERGGYRYEGVRRSVHFKDGVRVDLGIWSRLRGEGPLS
jgi:RimJ/RimL family protein N-acetyltransferase